MSVEEITYMSLWCTFLRMRSVDEEKSTTSEFWALQARGPFTILS